MKGSEFGRLYAEVFGVSIEYGKEICNSVFALIGDVLYNRNEDLIIQGFGSFKHKQAKAKNVRHPSTGEIITMPPRDYIKFTPSESMLADGNGD